LSSNANRPAHALQVEHFAADADKERDRHGDDQEQQLPGGPGIGMALSVSVFLDISTHLASFFYCTCGKTWISPGIIPINLRI
jgi:hypothetical protein